MKNSLTAAGALAVAALLCACSPDQPSVPAPRAVRTVEINYGNALDASRYVGTVQSRHEVEQSFRVGGKVAQRKVDVGQLVHEGDILAVLDDSDYRLAEEASQQQWAAAVEQTRQAESDRQRLTALKADGSVSA
ncbi:efflux RND transporter periplasmic adaptor subunit, partial [Pseudomonas sp. HMWF031]